MWGVDRLHPSERGHRLLARLFSACLAQRGIRPVELPGSEPSNPEPSAWAQAGWMATKGTGWLVRRSHDLVPRLLQLAATDWWHHMRGRDPVPRVPSLPALPSFQALPPAPIEPAQILVPLRPAADQPRGVQ